jgi:hypothetical protein
VPAIAVTAANPIPPRVGPVEFGTLGRWVTVRCPSDLAPLVRKAGAQWEPGSRQWLIERRRAGPLIRALRQATDPLFRWAGVDPDVPDRDR